MSRRSFMTGALFGGACGVLGTTGVHAVGHMTTGHQATETSAAHAGSHVDVGFCTDMAAHHMQAIEMCERVLGQDTGGPVQSAATEVIRNQSIEVGMMRAWLADWDASTAPPETVMGWMAMHGNMGGDTGNEMAEGMTMTAVDGAGIPLADMPGYATAAELLELSQADGLAQGRIWLQLMRAHHVGGVAMAEAAVELASQDKVIRLARTQAAVQSWEISQYDLLLESTYA